MNTQTLRQQRLRAHLTLQTVADRMEISAPHLLDIERGFRTLSPSLGAKYRRALGKKARPSRPGLEKTQSFCRAFKHKIVQVEWRVKWPVVHKNGKTYNPDLHCPALGCHLEVCTSWPNYSADRLKWAEVIRRGYKLRVYWWTGEDITQDVISGNLGSTVRSNHNLEL